MRQRERDRERKDIVKTETECHRQIDRQRETDRETDKEIERDRHRGSGSDKTEWGVEAKSMCSVAQSQKELKSGVPLGFSQNKLGRIPVAC